MIDESSELECIIVEKPEEKERRNEKLRVNGENEKRCIRFMTELLEVAGRKRETLSRIWIISTKYYWVKD
jgi:hypothetical protein